MVLEEAKINRSDYPCINYQQIDLSKGCNVKCIYCGLACNNGLTEKFNIDNILIDKQRPEGIYFSPNSDPFSKINCENTHLLLEKYLPLGVKILIITKKHVPIKTINLLAKYADQVIIKVSLARLDDKLSKYIEPGAESPKKRLQTLKNITNAGLKAQLLLMPLFPGVDDSIDKIEELVSAAKDCGCKYIKAAFVILRDGNKSKDQQILIKIKNHPALNKSREKMTKNIKIQVGIGKTIPFQERINFYKKINSICKKNGIIFSTCYVLDSELNNYQTNDFAICKDINSIYKI